MTWVMSVAHAHPVVAYISVGAVLSVAVGTWLSLISEGDLDDFCLFLCGMTAVAWPIMVLGAVLAIPAWLLRILWEWCDRRDFKPITWAFAWPCKLWVLADGWRFRRKVRKMIETGDTGIMDEDTGIVKEDEE